MSVIFIMLVPLVIRAVEEVKFIRDSTHKTM
jgi:hypothetical protein